MHRTSKLLNGRLSSVVTTLRYGETIVVADAGLPVPRGVETLDLALTAGVPSTAEVVTALKDSLVLLEVRIAREMATANRSLRRQIIEMFDDGQLVKEVGHVDGIESVLSSAKLVVQTGETTPYGNVVLVGGLDFFDITMAAEVGQA